MTESGSAIDHSSVNIFSMSHPSDLNDLRLYQELINDVVIPDANAVYVICSCELLETVREWLFRKLFNRCDDPLNFVPRLCRLTAPKDPGRGACL